MVVFAGGLAQSQVVREVLARYLGVESVTAHPLCQYNGAIGAAVLGRKRINREKHRTGSSRTGYI